MRLQLDWQGLPSQVAVRVVPPLRATTVVVRDPVKAAGLLRDVNDPLWDLLIRLADAGDLEVDGQGLLASVRHQTGELLELVPQRPGASLNWLREHLLGLRLGSIPTGNPDAEAVAAGLLQMHDFLEESHVCSQRIEGRGTDRSGDYWHGIMHRREPDYGNAKYWFRRVGVHPVFGEMAPEADTILRECGDPRSEQWRQRLSGAGAGMPCRSWTCVNNAPSQPDGPLERAVRKIQWTEMNLLLQHVCRAMPGRDARD